MINAPEGCLSYVENNILPQYDRIDDGHGTEHICDVLARAFDLNENLGLNPDMLSAAVFYHDLGRNIDDDTHEIISAEIFMNDEKMREFFDDEKRITIKEAIEDHRSTLKGEPRNIYGKLLSSADRNTNLEQPLKRTYAYRCKIDPNSSLEEKIRGSFEHLVKKFGKEGHARNVYFDDGAYEKYLNDLELLLDNYDLFRREYLRVNQIDEMQHYLKNVDKALIGYITKNLFPKYELNDAGHKLGHITEAIRRSFELKETLGLNLDDNLIYAIAACHDLGKYIDHETHEKIAADIFAKDENFKQIFTGEQRTIIKEAIEDHRSSLASPPRSKYGELISSADRNTSIDVTFKRSFAVGKSRTPDMPYDEYLDYTINRLRKKYDDENPENMFFVDKKYESYLAEMRKLLQDPEKFNARYSEVNGLAVSECAPLKDIE